MPPPSSLISTDQKPPTNRFRFGLRGHMNFSDDLEGGRATVDHERRETPLPDCPDHPALVSIIPVALLDPCGLDVTPGIDRAYENDRSRMIHGLGADEIDLSDAKTRIRQSPDRQAQGAPSQSPTSAIRRSPCSNTQASGYPRDMLDRDAVLGDLQAGSQGQRQGRGELGWHGRADACTLCRVGGTNMCLQDPRWGCPAQPVHRRRKSWMVLESGRGQAHQPHSQEAEQGGLHDDGQTDLESPHLHAASPIRSSRSEIKLRMIHWLRSGPDGAQVHRSDASTASHNLTQPSLQGDLTDRADQATCTNSGRMFKRRRLDQDNPGRFCTQRDDFGDGTSIASTALAHG